MHSKGQKDYHFVSLLYLGYKVFQLLLHTLESSFFAIKSDSNTYQFKQDNPMFSVMGRN